MDELSIFTDTLTNAGVVEEKLDTGVRFCGKMSTTVDIIASPYPGFATDLCPLCVPLLASFFGGSVRDLVFPTRFGYLFDLAYFGLSFIRLEGGVYILPSRIHPATVHAPDLRGGMAALILALLAKGESTIHSAETILRGYSSLTQKLSSLGAKIDFFG